MTKLKVAVIQTWCRESKAQNIESARTLVKSACEAGADLVVLPEMWSDYSAIEKMLVGAETMPGPSIAAVVEVANAHGAAIIPGSVIEPTSRDGFFRNTTAFIDETGTVLARYSKAHLFDINVPNVKYRESDYIEPGDALGIAEWRGFRFGLSICYDLRFPELFKRYRESGCHSIVLPAAFTSTTGKVHWDGLTRARAIENQVFFVTANQWGVSPNNIENWGRSRIVDPWGRMLCELADGVGFAIAELDLAELERIRDRSPIFDHRRDWLQKPLG